MAVSAKGRAPNHLGWLRRRRRRSLEPLIKTQYWGDRDVTENTIWNDWLFGQASTPPATIYTPRSRSLIGTGI